MEENAEGFERKLIFASLDDAVRVEAEQIWQRMVVDEFRERGAAEHGLCDFAGQRHSVSKSGGGPGGAGEHADGGGGGDGKGSGGGE